MASKTASDYAWELGPGHRHSSHQGPISAKIREAMDAARAEGATAELHTLLACAEDWEAHGKTLAEWNAHARMRHCAKKAEGGNGK